MFCWSSLNNSINQSINQLTNQPTVKPACLSDSQSVSQSVHPSVCPSVHQSVGLSFGQPVSHPFIHSVYSLLFVSFYCHRLITSIWCWFIPWTVIGGLGPSWFARKGSPRELGKTHGKLLSRLLRKVRSLRRRFEIHLSYLCSTFLFAEISGKEMWSLNDCHST